MRKIDTIIVHCTATRPEWWADKTPQQKLEECRRWHVEDRKWRDIGYHYLIDRDGTISEGRPIDQAGSHAKGHNSTSVGIALWGGHGGSQDDKFEENFTPEQDRSLRKLIAQLRMEYPAISTIMGHNEVSPKMCPCFGVTQWLNNAEPEPKAERKKISQSKTIQASSVAKIATLASPATIATVGGLEWQKLLIMGVFAMIALVALGVVDLERLKKWNKGDR